MDFSHLIINPTLAFIASIASVVIICLVAVNVISKMASSALRRSRLDSGVSTFLSSAIRVVLWGIAVIIIAERFGVPVNSLIAALGVAGLALSLSIQNLLSNMFSGVQIISTRPFTVGDFVELGSVSGTVSEIRLLQTKMKTSDNRIILVPNGEITASTIVNYSAADERRIELRFPVSQYADAADVKAAILSAVSANERVLKDPPPFVAADFFMDGRSEYIAQAWVQTPDFKDVRYELNEAISQSLLEHGIPLSSRGVSVNISNPDSKV